MGAAMTNRRAFIKGIAGFFPASTILSLRNDPLWSPISEAQRDYFKEIGVKPFINAAAAYSTLGGRNMWPEVVAAMDYARERNVIMKELQDAVGKRIASLIGCEAAMVTGGACSAMTLGTAACLTGTDQEAITRIPNLTGMKNEVIIQKAHRNVYDHAVRNCGVRFIEVETLEDLEHAVNERTAMMFYSFIHAGREIIDAKEFTAAAKKHNIPTLVDGSNTVPPVARLSEYLKIGFDLAAFSGGKGLRGPYSAGLLLGRKDLIEAARLNSSPNSDTVGRGMKVSKEEILGMLAAVEISLTFDYSVEVNREGRLLKLIADKIVSIPGIRTQFVYPKSENGRPHLQMQWDSSIIKLSADEAKRALQAGIPSVRTCDFELTGGYLEIGASMLKEKEIDVLVRCIRKVLQS